MAFPFFPLFIMGFPLGRFSVLQQGLYSNSPALCKRTVTGHRCPRQTPAGGQVLVWNETQN